MMLKTKKAKTKRFKYKEFDGNPGPCKYKPNFEVVKRRSPNLP